VRRLSLLLALMTLSACGVTSWTRQISPSEADRLVRDADAQIRAGRPALAIETLDDVVRRFPDASVHDQALYDLARALVLNANGGRDYRRAAAQLDRLLREHPMSLYTPDAKAWRAVLRAYAGRTAELEGLLERLRAIDWEFERPRQP
jgi:outer membrane protein assembly factor BamD (BamD/ComL family)